MTRLITLFTLIGIAFLLIKYRANEKLQRGVVVTLIGVFIIYVITVVTSELFR
jgi:hypothetical protein